MSAKARLPQRSLFTCASSGRSTSTPIRSKSSSSRASSTSRFLRFFLRRRLRSVSSSSSSSSSTTKPAPSCYSSQPNSANLGQYQIACLSYSFIVVLVLLLARVVDAISPVCLLGSDFASLLIEILILLLAAYVGNIVKEVRRRHVLDEQRKRVSDSVLVDAAIARNSCACCRGRYSGCSGWRVKEERRELGSKEVDSCARSKRRNNYVPDRSKRGHHVTD